MEKKFNLQYFALAESKVMSAREGKLFLTINNRVKEVGSLIEGQAKVSAVMMEYATIGTRMKQQKMVGLEGTGSVKFHMIDNFLRQAFANFKKTGIEPKIDLQFVNNDPTVTGGRIVTNFTGVRFKDSLMNQIGADSTDALAVETDFTFNDFTIIEDTKY